MDLKIVWKVLIAIVGLVVIATYLQPLLVPLAPPFGVIILIVLYIGVVAWLFGLVGTKGV